jgi:hypothetical protein
MTWALPWVNLASLNETNDVQTDIWEDGPPLHVLRERVLGASLFGEAVYAHLVLCVCKLYIYTDMK